MTDKPIDPCRRALMTASGALALAGCSVTGDAQRVPRPNRLSPALPLDLSARRLTKITVCARPFRAAGPRIEGEEVAGKPIVHAYGHGGAGWSLSWGTADEVAKLVFPKSPKTAAVVGAGAIGMAVATVLQRQGIDTTIYAKAFRGETPSARATGTWSPQSRIAKTAEMPSGFEQTWERMARRSYAVHEQFVGLQGNPVDFTPRYVVPSDEEQDAPSSRAGFFKPGRLSELVPEGGAMAPDSHPFPVTTPPRTFLTLTFNIAEYSNRLWTEFLLMGGKAERRVFSAPAELAALPEDIVVNCTGYGARALWSDDSVIPYRGQIGWLAPQPDRLYGIYHKNVSILSRRDGVVVQYRGPNENYGLGIDDLTPDRAEFDRALAVAAPLFAGWPRV